ncbi:aldolase/citrate lyase family protein [uncultured Sphaerochaeta sp.]|uniref:aldolase/citrate lyase family protein n=1 Tax=uncultured Sphaerochaeta sp. TaxID=886478 RepID=UPI002A0A568E|nr:aldolase/citrate lyase family protein [uncultured Sphaerochaeta sp.]
MDLQVYLKEAKDSFIRIVQIEHKTAVENIEAILGVAGLDAIIIGPNDLSASVGLLGHSMHPEVLEMGKIVILAAKKAGKPVGVSIGPDQTTIKTWMDMGVDFISVGDDISFLQQGASQTLGFVARQSGKSV